MARTPGCSFPSPNLSPVLTLTSQMLQRQCTLNEGYETVDVPAESIRAAVGRKDCLLAKCDGSLLAYVQYQATLGYTTGRNELAFEGNNIERVMSIQSGMSLLDLEVGRSEIETYGSYGGRPERFLLRCDSLYPGSGNEGLKIDFGTNQYAFARLDFASRSARQSRSQASFRLVYWEVTGAEAESGDDGSRPVSSIHIFCGPSELSHLHTEYRTRTNRWRSRCTER